jgi:hypothetical protein
VKQEFKEDSKTNFSQLWDPIFESQKVNMSLVALAWMQDYDLVHPSKLLVESTWAKHHLECDCRLCPTLLDPIGHNRSTRLLKLEWSPRLIQDICTKEQSLPKKTTSIQFEIPINASLWMKKLKLVWWKSWYITFLNSMCIGMLLMHVFFWLK